MTISSLPTPPNRAQSPEAFADAADSFLAALPAFGTEANALATEVNAAKVAAELAETHAAASAADAAVQVSLATAKANAAAAAAASALNAPGTNAFATDSLTIGLGTKTFSIQTGKAFSVGQFVILARAANPGNYMVGQITAHNATTGAVTLNATATGGNGTYSNWNVALTAPVDAAAGAGGVETTTTATSFTLSTTAKRLQVIAFTAESQSVTLPDATALPLGGELYVIENTGSYQFAVRDSAGTLKTIIQPGQIGAAYLKDNTTAAGSWAFGSMRGELGGLVFGTGVSTSVTDSSYAKTVWLTDTTAFVMTGNGTVYYTIATVSGGSISFSTPGTLSSFTNMAASRLIKLTPTLLVHWYSGTMRAISISGTTATIGTAVTVTIGNDGGVMRVSDSVFLLYYQAASTYYSTATLYSVSGTTITTVSGGVLASSSTGSKVLYGAMVAENRAVVPFAYSGMSFYLLNVTASTYSKIGSEVHLSDFVTMTTPVLLGVCKSRVNEFVVVIRDASALTIPPKAIVLSTVGDVFTLKKIISLDVAYSTETNGLGMSYVRDGVVMLQSSAVTPGYLTIQVIRTTGKADDPAYLSVYGATTYGFSVDTNSIGDAFLAGALTNTATRLVTKIEVA